MIRNWPVIILILLGFVTWSLTMVKSGLVYDYGMGFWGANGHDGVWHLAIIEHFSRHWNLDSPILAGEKLTNYHFLFDVLVAVLNRMLPLGAVTWYFQIIPPLLALGIGWAAYNFMVRWTGSKVAAGVGVFFIYFGGSWGWLVNYFRYGNWSGESMFWANQAISTLINPPYALSILMLLAGLTLWLDYVKKPSRKLWLITGLIFGLLIHAKAYAGVLVVGGLGGLALVEMVAKLKSLATGHWSLGNLPNCWLGFLAGGITLLTFLPLNRTAANLLVFSPLWFPHTMLEFGDRFNWPQLEYARQAYWATGIWWKALLAEVVAVGIFIVGNLGTRIIGLVALLRVSREGGVSGKGWKVAPMDLFLLTMLLVAVGLPLLFIQKGNPWNTVQFFYYAQVIMALYAGKAVAELSSWGSFTTSDSPSSRPFGLTQGKLRPGSMVGMFLVIVISILTLPTTLDSLQHYLPSRPPARIPNEELEALAFLRLQPEGVVLTYPFQPELRNFYDAPKPLAYYETTAYVSAFSGKPVFLEDEMNLEITGADWRPRREMVDEFFEDKDGDWSKHFLEENKIKYVYIKKEQSKDLNFQLIDLEIVHENNEVVVWKFLDSIAQRVH